MVFICPNCSSPRVIRRDIAKKTCGLLGILGGVASVSSGALTGAELGATFGVIAGPPGSVIGGTAGALLGLIIASASGGLTGAKIGAVIDEKVLDNYQCLHCHFVFGKSL